MFHFLEMIKWKFLSKFWQSNLITPNMLIIIQKWSLMVSLRRSQNDVFLQVCCFQIAGFVFCGGMIFLSSKAFEGGNNHVKEYPCRLIYGPFLTEIYGHMTSNCFNSEISPFSYWLAHTSSNNSKLDQNSNWSSLKSVGRKSNGMLSRDYFHQMLYWTKIIPPRTRFHSIKTSSMRLGWFTLGNKFKILVEMKNHPWFSSDFESFGHLLEEEEERVSFKLGQSDSEWVMKFHDSFQLHMTH